MSDTYLVQQQLDAETNEEQWIEFCDGLQCINCVHCAVAETGKRVCTVADPFTVDIFDTCPELWELGGRNAEDYPYREEVKAVARKLPGFGEYDLMDELERLNIR